MKTKRPAFQFYPADWLNDLALRQCSAIARCLWADMLCLMHEGEPYGHLRTEAGDIAIGFLARISGLTTKQVIGALDEMASHKVYSMTEEGTIYSRRMVRDEEVRNLRAAGGEGGKQFGKLGAEHGIKGGRPKKETGDNKPPLKPSPSSPSSSPEDSSDEESKPPAPLPPWQLDPTYTAICDTARAFWPDSLPEDFAEAHSAWKRLPTNSKLDATAKLNAKQATSPGQGHFVCKNFARYMASTEWKRKARDPTGSGSHLKPTQAQAAMLLMKKRIERGEAPL